MANFALQMARPEIYRHFGGRCVYCDKLLLLGQVQLDHVVARLNGGKTTFRNTVTACRQCNMKKKDGPPLVPVQLPLDFKGWRLFPIVYSPRSRASQLIKQAREYFEDNHE